jgi:hypothetical protein
MTQYDNTNRGVLFDNDRKETDSHPDMTGTLNINGVDHWFSAWWKQGSKGEFLSLSIGKAKDQQGQRQAPQQRQADPPQRRGGNRPSQQPASRAPQRGPGSSSNGFDDLDSDVPF